MTAITLCIYKHLIAVYIDSLVMISIERSQTNRKRALEIRDKIFFHNFSIKHDILRLFAKKNFGENFFKSKIHVCRYVHIDIYTDSI